MIYLNNAILRQKPNTFIGGVASTIPNAVAMAGVLGINRNKIRNYRIVGDDVEFHVTNNYNIKADAFFGNEDITYYRDEDSKLKVIGRGAFMNAVNLEEVKGLGIRRLGNNSQDANGTFRGCINLKRFITSEKWVSVNGRYEFYGCELLEDVDISYLTNFVHPPEAMFQNCKNLPPITFNENYTGVLGQLMFRNSTLVGVDLQKASGIGQNTFRESKLMFPTLYSDYVLSVGNHGFRHLNVNSTIETIEFPNCTQIGDSAFYRILEGEYKNIILPKVTTLTGNTHFAVGNQPNEVGLYSLIDLRSLKTFSGNNEVFRLISTQGVTIKLHQDIDPNDPNIIYALSRNAIVELYDDNGDYVTNL